MDWSNETYVKLFTRDTVSWKRLRWEGQTVLMHLLRKLDRGGRLDGVEDAVLDVSIMTGLPEDVVSDGIKACIREKIFKVGGNILYMPNFTEAQETPKSDKLRQKESRQRRRIDAENSINSTSVSRNVTDSHKETIGVTAQSEMSLLAEPCIAEPCEANPNPVSSGTAIAKPVKKKPAKKTEAKSNEVWKAYSWAYEQRYKVKPVRNAQTNSQACKLVDKLGPNEAPHVAAYYVTLNNSFYVTKGHSIGILVADAEKVRTEWATGNNITQTKAREADRAQAVGDGWLKAIEKHGDK